MQQPYHDYVIIFKHTTNRIYRAANGSPNITVAKQFNVTVEQTNILRVNTTDPDGDTVTVNLTSSLPEGVNFNGRMYTWTPVNMDPVNISYVSCVVLVSLNRLSVGCGIAPRRQPGQYTRF